MDASENSSPPDAMVRRYLMVVLGLTGLLLLVVLSLNLLLGARALGSAEATRMASAWQQETRGVTYAPPISATRPFKMLRLADRLPEVNALVLGSSTMMGITEDLFVPPLRLYNFSQTGNGTAAIVAEAEYVERHWGDRIRWLVVGLDWSVGMIYNPVEAGAVDLSAAKAVEGFAVYTVPWHKQVEDALSWPRVENLAKVLMAALKSPAPLRAVKHAFFDIAGEPYRCGDDSLARDFDVINRGLCRGFRYDGSWTFANDRRLTETQAATYAVAAAAVSSKYTKHLCDNDGAPNAEYLRRLGETAQRMAKRGGQMVFLLPPLVPGMEKTMMKTPRWKACLDRTKSDIHDWAARHQIAVVDAGASERYGCAPSEFSDEHHAYSECQRKVFARVFSGKPPSP